MEMIAGLKHQITAWAVFVYAMGIGIMDAAGEVVQLLAAIAALVLVIINILLKWRELKKTRAAEAVDVKK